jgi:hypothetical protein
LFATRDSLLRPVCTEAIGTTMAVPSRIEAAPCWRCNVLILSEQNGMCSEHQYRTVPACTGSATAKRLAISGPQYLDLYDIGRFFRHRRSLIPQTV